MSQNTKPEITVVIPYYNEEKSIEMTLELVSSQTLPPRCCILVNSSSSDRSSQIITEWIKNYQGLIQFSNIFENTKTPSSSKNVGIKKATTEWVALMDCGQIFSRDWLLSQWQFLQKNSDCDWVSGVCHFKGVGVIDECAVAHTYGYDRKRPTMPTSLIPKRLFDKFGLFLTDRRAGYDAAWPLLLSKNHIKRGVNEEVIIRYERVNFGSNLWTILKKSFNYNLPTVDMPHYYVPYYYLLIFLGALFIFLYSPVTGLSLAIIMLIIRSYILSGFKSQSFILLKKSFAHWLYLPVVAVFIDIGRILGILTGTWKYHLSHIFE